MLSIIIPSLDPFVSQLSDLKTTLSSINILKNCTYFEVVLVMPIAAYCPSKMNNLLSQYDISLRHAFEPASSHSDALNEGIHASQGSHVLILNPGDQLFVNASIIRTISSLDSGIMYSYNVISNGTFVGTVHKISDTKDIFEYIKSYGIFSFLNLAHQGLLIPRRLHEDMNLFYDVSFDLRMDFDLMAQIANLAKNTNFIIQCSLMPISYYPVGGKSMAIANRARFYQEANKSLNERLNINSKLLTFKTFSWKLYINNFLAK